MSNPASRSGPMRAADTDRIQVAQLLTDAAAQGRLQLNEYEDRLTRAYAAQTYDELDRLSADLPGAITRGRSGGPCRPAPSTMLLAIMSGFERRGRWNVPRRMTTFALFGGGVVDLRYADFGQVQGRGVRRRRVILRGDGSGGQCRRRGLLFARGVVDGT
ncbi:DUF1707 SHOCT-like domain-containing protein [Mycobacterium neumannii]|uniref:DUF1707 SHOCT-like domain-containing protein n=1 Tax=Mycobacterium neumannii TaxID=2048551 RepID=UPI000B94439A|nr:DUF1707 domain-containing protein [Mycobacterium neumannii]